MPMQAENFRDKRIRTTNSLINALSTLTPANFANNFDGIEVLSSLKADWDVEKYEEKEKEIPELIYEVLKKDSNTFTKLVKRDYFEEDAWLVSVESRESEKLEDNGHEILSDFKNQFVKIHIPKIFVRTLSLPMIDRNH